MPSGLLIGVDFHLLRASNAAAPIRINSADEGSGTRGFRENFPRWIGPSPARCVNLRGEAATMKGEKCRFAGTRHRAGRFFQGFGSAFAFVGLIAGTFLAESYRGDDEPAEVDFRG